MIRFAFRKGLRFLCNAVGFTLDRRLPNGNFRLEDDQGEATNLSEKELHERWASGKWQIDPECLGAWSNVFYYTTPKDLKAYPEDVQTEAKRKLSYIQGVQKLFAAEGQRFVSTREKLEPKIAQVAAEIKDDKGPPGPDALWRWWQRFAPTKCVTKLVELFGRAGRPTNAVHRSIFDEAVCEVFLTSQKMPGKAVFEAVENKVERINQGVPEAEKLKPPSRATVYRWLKTLYHEVVKKAREGKAATLKELRSVVGAVKVDKILERVELDHTPLDLLVICKLTKMILGRPWLTLAIDRFSRMVLGFYISFHAPSGTSVLYCLRMMIMPKEQLLERFPDVVGPWPARGIPDRAVVDNGMDLHADAVEAICLEMGIELQYCGVARPEMKGAIERVIGTVNRTLIHTLPGTTFSNVSQRGDYDSEEHAALDIETLTHVLVKWIVDVYHKTPHRGLAGRTPLSVWQEGEADRIVELPAFPRQLETIIGHTADRTLFHYGVEYENLRYNSPLLQTIRQREGGTPVVKMRAFEHDAGYVAVFDPHLDEFIDVPAVDEAYAAGLNRHVHRLVCEEVRRRFGNGWTSPQLREVKLEIQAIVDEAVRAKKTGTRKAAAVATMTDSEQVFREDSAEALARACDALDTADGPTAPIDPGTGDQLPVFKKSVRIEEEVAA